MVLFNCEDVTFSYDGVKVLSNVNFSVKSGDYLCILGVNGAGKSTLMKGILGLLKQSSGKISYCDKLSNNEIGYLPQQTAIQKDFPASVWEVVLSGCLNKCKILPFYKKAQKNMAKRNIELMGIKELKNKCYQELSGGQQQRVLLARALCATGKLLVLDEPTTGLDPVAANELYELIKHLNKQHNITVIMVSHDIVGAIKNATHILHLDHDKSFYGTIDEYQESDFSKKFLSDDGGKSV